MNPPAETSGKTALATLGADLRAVAPAWLIARVLVGAAYLLARGIDRAGDAPRAAAQISSGLFAWDGNIYREIALHGYGADRADLVKFFPGLPVIARGLGAVVPMDLSLLVVTNVAALGALVLLRVLVRHERGDDALAGRAVTYLALAPASFVLVWSYAESVFLLGAIGAFVAARQRRWWWVVPAAGLAALSRPLGVVLVAPLLIEALRVRRDVPLREWVARGAAVVAAPVALAMYLAWINSVIGDALAPFREQGPLRGGLENPLFRLGRAVGDMVGAERFGDGLHTPFIVAMLVLVVVCFRKWPPSYGVFAALVMAVALAAPNLNSIERYGMVNAFPLVLALASITAADRWRRVAEAACGVGFVSLASLAWLGVFVP